MAKWEPVWTEEVKIESGGRYPLLLNRFHAHLEDLLIKGIVSTTDRLRYISYCCWAIGDIEETLNCKSYYEFEEAFKRREAALAVGIYFLKPTTKLGNYTTYGIEAMRTYIGSEDEIIDCSFRILPSQPMGAFGQYYKGTMQNWGLIYVDSKGIIMLTDSGRELYKIMNTYYSDCQYFRSFRGKQHIPGNVLKRWAKINEFDNITDPYHQEEREFYKEILFHLDTNKDRIFRRDSLVVYLETIMMCNEKNIPFDEDVLRNLFYYKKIMRNDSIENATLSPFLDDVLFYWSVYESHVYFSFWITEYFKFFLSLLKTVDGILVAEIISINKNEFNEKAKEIINSEVDFYSIKFKDFIAYVKLANKPDEHLLEEKITNMKYNTLSQLSAGLLIMLSLLYFKHDIIKNDLRYIELKLNLSDDFWFDEFLRDIEVFKNYSIMQILKILLNRFVIQKHDKAMCQKNDLRRCWFTKSGAKYYFEADANSTWRTAKHNNICNFLFDMDLITVNSERFVVTEEGLNLYKILKEKYYIE